MYTDFLFMRSYDTVVFMGNLRYQYCCDTVVFVCRELRSWRMAPKRDAILDAARPNDDITGSACRIGHGISRRSGRNSANFRASH